MLKTVIKNVFYTLFIVLPLGVAGQIKDSLEKWHLIAELPGENVKIFLYKERSDSYGNYLLYYKNEQKWDTLKCEYEGNSVDSVSFKSVQIDGKGLKEIVITWTYDYRLGDAYISYTEVKMKKNVIWNLDSKKIIFSAINYYSEKEIYYKKDKLDNGCMYSYDFAINNASQVVISKLITKGLQLRCKPDHLEGIYNLKDNN